MMGLGNGGLGNGLLGVLGRGGKVEGGIDREKMVRKEEEKLV